MNSETFSLESFRARTWSYAVNNSILATRVGDTRSRIVLVIPCLLKTRPAKTMRFWFFRQFKRWCKVIANQKCSFFAGQAANPRHRANSTTAQPSGYVGNQIVSGFYAMQKEKCKEFFCKCPIPVDFAVTYCIKSNCQICFEMIYEGLEFLRTFGPVQTRHTFRKGIQAPKAVPNCPSSTSLSKSHIFIYVSTVTHANLMQPFSALRPDECRGTPQPVRRSP